MKLSFDFSPTCIGSLPFTNAEEACKKVLETGRPAFSDFEFYAPSGGSATGFLASVIVNEDGDRIGLMALQIHANQIDPIMQESTGLGKTAETYLLGSDLKMRSNSVLAEHETILKASIQTEQARLWLKEHDEHGEQQVYPPPKVRPCLKWQ